MTDDPNFVEGIRLAIAQQPTVEQGLAALFRALSKLCHDAADGDHGQFAQLTALADAIDADPRAWSDAVLANTKAAELTMAPVMPVLPVQVQDAMPSHGSHHTSDKEKHDKAQDKGRRW
jgi:hypothetical protein